MVCLGIACPRARRLVSDAVLTPLMAVSRHSRLRLGVKERFTKVRFGPRKPIPAPRLVVNLAVAPSEEAIPPSVSGDQKQESDDFVVDFHEDLFIGNPLRVRVFFWLLINGLSVGFSLMPYG